MGPGRHSKGVAGKADFPKVDLWWSWVSHGGDALLASGRSEPAGTFSVSALEKRASRRWFGMRRLGARMSDCGTLFTLLLNLQLAHALSSSSTPGSAHSGPLHRHRNRYVCGVGGLNLLRLFSGLRGDFFPLRAFVAQPPTKAFQTSPTVTPLPGLRRVEETLQTPVRPYWSRGFQVLVGLIRFRKCPACL